MAGNIICRKVSEAMGYDLYAYVDLDQTHMEDFIKSEGLDKLDWEHGGKIAEKYAEKYLPKLNETGYDMRPFYSYQEDCQIHTMHYSVGTNFIRDDSRFENRHYLKAWEQKHRKKFLYILQNMNCTIRTRCAAQEAAQAIETFFSDDEDLMRFSKWLRETSKICDIYELSR